MSKLAVLAAAVASAVAAERDAIALLRDAVAAGAGHRAPVVAPLPEPLAAPSASYTPVVLMHGLGDAGSNPGMQSLAQSIMTAYPGIYAVAVDVADGLLSFITPMADQVAQLAAVVQADPKLAGGFHLVGLSQGGGVARGYIETVNDPPVHRFVSICGVVNGEFDCPLEIDIIPFLCDLFKSDPYRFLFNGSLPLSFSDYWVQVSNRSQYLSQNTWLPVLNNEVPHPRAANFTANIQSLTSVLLVEATEDAVVIPYVAEQLGGYVWDTTNGTTYDFFASPHYTQNLVGFRTLYDHGVLSFAQFAGGHLGFNDSFWNTVILPQFASG